MFSNPFSPIFGGKPDVFFGREKWENRTIRAAFDKSRSQKQKSN